MTGAGSGIGRATALRCAEEGAFVAVTDVDDDGGRETVEQIADLEAGDAAFHGLDVTDADRFDEVVLDLAAERGLDVVVNNAGVSHPPASMEDVEASVRDFVIDVNVKGVWNGCAAALPVMKEQGHGSIVNVGSLASLLGLPKQSAYSLSKGAVLNFTRAVAAEAGPYGVRANTVCPGFTDTPLGRQYFEARDDPEAAREKMAEQYPLKRLGDPEEIAAAILFLASDEASWITGEGLVVDGGFSTN